MTEMSLQCLILIEELRFENYVVWYSYGSAYEENDLLGYIAVLVRRLADISEECVLSWYEVKSSNKAAFLYDILLAWIRAS
jgi:hypothetical protein